MLYKMPGIVLISRTWRRLGSGLPVDAISNADNWSSEVKYKLVETLWLYIFLGVFNEIDLRRAFRILLFNEVQCERNPWTDENYYCCITSAELMATYLWFAICFDWARLSIKITAACACWRWFAISLAVITCYALWNGEHVLFGSH